LWKEFPLTFIKVIQGSLLSHLIWFHKQISDTEITITNNHAPLIKRGRVQSHKTFLQNWETMNCIEQNADLRKLGFRKRKNINLYSQGKNNQEKHKQRETERAYMAMKMQLKKDKINRFKSRTLEQVTSNHVQGVKRK
jgi:hypothetical protein